MMGKWSVEYDTTDQLLNAFVSNTSILAYHSHFNSRSAVNNLRSPENSPPC